MLKVWLFGVLLAATPTPDKRHAEIEKWVRHYSAKMGIEPAGIVFGSLPGDWCGVTGRAIQWDGVYVGFDTGKRLCRTWPAREQALHEMCHVKLNHTHSTATDKAKHREVDSCVRKWR